MMPLDKLVVETVALPNLDVALTPAKLSDWKDGEIVHLAMVAHEKMLEVYSIDQEVLKTDYGIPNRLRKKIPNVTTTLVVDNTAYISSSVRGETFMYVSPSLNRYTELRADAPCDGAVRIALNNCKTAEGWGHKNAASCGEVWAVQGYCSTGSTRSLEGARTVAIASRAIEDTKTTKPVIIDPCGNWDKNKKDYYEGAWECTQFTKKLGLYVSPDSATSEPKDVNDDDVTNSLLLYRRT